MAELAISAAAVGFAGFALQSVNTLIGTVDAVRDAPKELSSIRTEVAGLGTVLQNFQQLSISGGRQGSSLVLANPRTPANGPLEQTLQLCKADVDALDSDIRGFTKHSTGSTDLSKRDRINVVLHSSSIESTRKRLAVSKNTFHLALTAYNTHIAVQTGQATVAIQGQIDKAVTDIATSQISIEERLEAIRAQLRDETALLEACRASQSAAAASLKRDSQTLTQQFGKATLTDRADVFAGIQGVDLSTKHVDQTYGDINASGDSKGVFGIRNVYNT